MLDRNYLRVRGEYTPISTSGTSTWELPPRARRIQPWSTGLISWSGTTSACAENTIRFDRAPTRFRNYLRVRGEYAVAHHASHQQLELPPRARRILVMGIHGCHGIGTTSACAENTQGRTHGGTGHGNYLRVRGEYLHFSLWQLLPLELPPRARRILHDLSEPLTQAGTTSACAENTPLPRRISWAVRNYLRVRGEYPREWASRPVAGELPPRARRIQKLASGVSSMIGTTSACAENTPPLIPPLPHRRNYLRVRGEYLLGWWE